ncbi:MAG: glycogen debranching enzyme N-terminal domain-containing protein, partial [Planctomycetota bacterium]
MARRRSKSPASKPLPAEKGPRSVESSRSAGSPLVSGDDLRDLDRALRLEWFEPDGAGGFAMSSVLGCPTRRQHGLLVIRPQ